MPTHFVNKGICCISDVTLLARIEYTMLTRHGCFNRGRRRSHRRRRRHWSPDDHRDHAVANIAATSVSTVPCPAVHPYPETHRNTGWSQNHDMQNVLQNRDANFWQTHESARDAILQLFVFSTLFGRTLPLQQSNRLYSINVLNLYK